MIYQPIDRTTSRWCILRTSGGKTLALAASLTVAGVEAWTPKRTFKRPMPGKRPDQHGRRPMIEIDAPILPTFVFARAVHVDRLMGLAADPASLLPAFSVFTHAGRAPEVGDHAVAGLRQAERDAEEAIQAIRDADTREEKRKLRAEALSTDRARRKAMRAQRLDFAAGEVVTVADMPALGGMDGVVERSDGRSAVVMFGGLLNMTIEAWRLVRDPVQGCQS